MIEDINHGLLMIVAVLVSLCALGRLYYENIQDFFLRKILVAATHLVILIQDTGDREYKLAWKVICDSLESIDPKLQPQRIDEIFSTLLSTLLAKANEIKNTDGATKELSIVNQAISITTVWRQSIRSEIDKAEKIGNLKIDVKRFVKIIKDMDLA